MNPQLFRLVVVFVGTALVLTVIGIIVLAWGVTEGSGRSIPDTLQVIASGALTGLLGLVVNPRE